MKEALVIAISIFAIPVGYLLIEEVRYIIEDIGEFITDLLCNRI